MTDDSFAGPNSLQRTLVQGLMNEEQFMADLRTA
jgi:hypothetical protein